MKVNFDAAIFANFQMMGVGVVIGNCLGDFLAGFWVQAPLLLDAKCAKAYASGCALKLFLSVIKKLA